MYSTSLHLLFSSDYVICLLPFTNIAKLVFKKASVGMYYTYVLITPTTLVCFLALPSLLHFSLSNYFLYLSVFIFLMILDHSVILISFKDHN